MQFHPDAAFVIGSLPDGSIAVRYGATQAAALAADAPALQCRCIEPTVCIENTCAITGTGTGNAKCRGGCYRANGDACVSCRFFAVTPPPSSPAMPGTKDATPVKSPPP